jgi:TorA maturation chaperone TorD
MNDPLAVNSPNRMQAELDLACELLYRFFAAALADPRRQCRAILTDRISRALARQAADLVRGEFAGVSIPLGFGESPPEDLDLRSILKCLPASSEELADEYVRVFGLATCRECPPYETEYHAAEDPFFRAQQMADIAGFYRAFGLQPGSDGRERPDFIGLELEFLALLHMKQRDAGVAETAAICEGARRQFFQDHLSWWTPSFALALRHKAEYGFYESVAWALSALLPIERYRQGIAAPLMPLEAKTDAAPESCEGCLLAAGA